MEKKDIASIGLFLFDLDGTLYLGDVLFPFTKELLRAIRAKGKKYLFMTNNSSKSVADYVKKLTRIGIDCAADDFVTSAQATIRYLLQNHAGLPLYVCGTRSLKAEFEAAGLTVTENADEAGCVVMGYDTELDYKKLLDVSRLLTERPGMPYIATNPDLVCPTEFGYVPDCGSVCAMIKNATGRIPVVIGKPEPMMPRLAMERARVEPSKCAVVGDRIYTDVKSGLNAGAKGILVLSGETTREILGSSDAKPDLVLRDAGEMIEYI